MARRDFSFRQMADYEPDQKKHENAGIQSSYASHFPYCSPTSIRCLCANSVIVWKATNGSLERWLSGLRQRLVRVAMRLKSHRRFESFPSPPLPTDFLALPS